MSNSNFSYALRWQLEHKTHATRDGAVSHDLATAREAVAKSHGTLQAAAEFLNRLHFGEVRYILVQQMRECGHDLYQRQRILNFAQKFFDAALSAEHYHMARKANLIMLADAHYRQKNFARLYTNGMQVARYAFGNDEQAVGCRAATDVARFFPNTSHAGRSARHLLSDFMRVLSRSPDPTQHQLARICANEIINYAPCGDPMKTKAIRQLFLLIEGSRSQETRQPTEETFVLIKTILRGARRQSAESQHALEVMLHFALLELKDPKTRALAGQRIVFVADRSPRGSATSLQARDLLWDEQIVQNDINCAAPYIRTAPTPRQRSEAVDRMLALANAYAAQDQLARARGYYMAVLRSHDITAEAREAAITRLIQLLNMQLTETLSQNVRIKRERLRELRHIQRLTRLRSPQRTELERLIRTIHESG